LQALDIFDQDKALQSIAANMHEDGGVAGLAIHSIAISERSTNMHTDHQAWQSWQAVHAQQHVLT